MSPFVQAVNLVNCDLSIRLRFWLNKQANCSPFLPVDQYIHKGRYTNDVDPFFGQIPFCNDDCFDGLVDSPGANGLYLRPARVPHHAGDRAGFDADMFEFQQEFMIATMGPYVTAIDMPLVSVWNPDPQRNDLPDQLAIQ